MVKLALDLFSWSWVFILPHQRTADMNTWNSGVQSKHDYTHKNQQRSFPGWDLAGTWSIISKAHATSYTCGHVSSFMGSRTASTPSTNPGPHQGWVSTHLLVRWSLGESPFSPKMVMKTLASVPAPRTSPVTVTTSYTGGGKEKLGASSEENPESYLGSEKPGSC